MQSYSKSELRQIIHQLNNLVSGASTVINALVESQVDEYDGLEVDNILNYISVDDLKNGCNDLLELLTLIHRANYSTLESETVKPYLVKYSLDNFATENAVIYAQPAISPMNDSRFDHAREFLGNRFGKPVVIISISEITVVEGN